MILIYFSPDLSQVSFEKNNNNQNVCKEMWIMQLQYWLEWTYM